MSYESEHAFAKDLAQEAGKVMLKYFRSDAIDLEWKADDTPLTIADKTINDLVIDRVKAVFPNDGVLGEEASFEQQRDRIWVVDPIDGTMPFSIGMPVSTFSLALVNRSDGQPVLAATYDPWLQELYTATKGGGAFMNGVQINTSDETSLKRACVATSSRSLDYDGGKYHAGAFSDALRAEGARTVGFASFVYTSNRVAAGQLLGSVVGDAGAWDIAASSLLVQEAGGIVTDLRGLPRRFDESGLGCVQAANQQIHDQLMKLLDR